MLRAAILGGVLCLAPLHVADAQLLWKPPGEQQPDEPSVVELEVSPAAEPRPALRYSLMPEYDRRKPGNAAPYYHRAISSVVAVRGVNATRSREEREQWNIGSRWQAWRDLPDEDYPVDAAHELVAIHEHGIAELRVAAFREKCDWGLRFRDVQGMEAIAFRLEEFQESREVARLLAVQARLQVVESRHEEAIRTLQLGLQLGHDVSKIPILINDLIGVSIASTLRTEIEHLLASPDCPNLYWALAAIPDPYVDMKWSLEQEALLAESVFPFLRDAETARHSDEEWNRIVRDALERMNELRGYTRIGGGSDQQDVVRGTYSAALMAKAFPAARERLVSAGYTREAIDAMPVGRVISLDAQRTHRYIRDELMKWGRLPLRDAWRGMQATERRLRRDGYLGPRGAPHESLPVSSALMPAVARATVTPVRVERDFRALRIVEALRMHAAEHGEFPKSLDDITAVPIPDNPWTGGDFPYRYENGVAELDVASPEGFPKRSFSRIYRLKIRK